MYEIFELLCKKCGITPYKFCKETGINSSTISTWKKNNSLARPELAKNVCEYFHISMDYLMTGQESEPKEPVLTPKDERDIQKKLNDTLNQLESQDGLMFDGEVLDEETKELLRISIESAIRTAKITAKKKFTPKKYK